MFKIGEAWIIDPKGAQTRCRASVPLELQPELQIASTGVLQEQFPGAVPRCSGLEHKWLF